MQDGKHVILYVDDDPDYRYAMRQLLEANGLVMAEAGDGEEGLRIYKEADPDLVILDLMMEEVDSGVDLLRSLRAEGNEAPIYLLSSVGDTMAMTMDASELGFIGILQKPIDNERLLSIIRSRLH